MRFTGRPTRNVIKWIFKGNVLRMHDDRLQKCMIIYIKGGHHEYIRDPHR